MLGNHAVTDSIETNRLGVQLDARFGPVSMHVLFSVILVLPTFALVAWFAAAMGAYSAPLFFILFGLIGGGIAARMGERALLLFTLAYCWTVIFSIGLHQLYLAQYGVPYYVGGSDDLAYEKTALLARELPIFNYAALLNINLYELNLQQVRGSIGYAYLVGLIVRLGDGLGGYHTILPRIFNGFLLGMLSIATYRVALRWQIDRTYAFWAALATGLLPIMTYTSAHIFRDTFMSLMMMLTVLLWAPTTHQDAFSRAKRWLVTILFSVITYQIRPLQAGILVIVALVADVFVTARPRQALQRLFIMMGCGALVLLMVPSVRATVVALALRVPDMQGRYGDYRLGKADGLSTYVFSAGFPLGYILRTGYGLIVPLPIAYGTLDRALLSIETLIQYAFLPFTIGGLIIGVTHRRMWPLIAMFCGLYFGAVLITFTQRHIILYLPFGAILAAYGYTHLRRYRLPIWGGMAFAGLLLVAAYLFLKAL